MLLSVAAPDRALALSPGVSLLDPEDATLVHPAVGFALFDVPPTSATVLPKTGQIEVRLRSPLDGRRYSVRRALDVLEHWQVFDDETGWPAAAGAVDVERWLRSSFAIPDEQPLPGVFRALATISLPASLIWLHDQPGLRERRLASLLNMEAYPRGLRWLQDVSDAMRAATAESRSATSQLRGREEAFEAITRRFEAARAAALESAGRLASLRSDLESAQVTLERLRALEVELAETQRSLSTQRAAIVGAEANIEALRQRLMVRDRARAGMAEYHADWQLCEEATVEIAKLLSSRPNPEALQAQFVSVGAEALGLQREKDLLDEQLTFVAEAEKSAADLDPVIHRQQQLDQQLAAAQERAARLQLANRALQRTLEDSKRIEVVLADVERHLSELEQLAAQGLQTKKIQNELDRQREQLRDAAHQADQIHFIETAVRAMSSHLDELRRSSSVTERLTVGAAAGNGSPKPEERTLAVHLRHAVDQQLLALERQIGEWQAQSRDLAGASLRVNQLRASMHQLEQELAATRQIEVKLGALPILRQQRKQLRERFDQVKKQADTYVKE
ncbi:MAG TPA: hypothetical protein VKU60_14680, partial [Chloroflexota bacterium]|nr:hypothetical protein [Chloroflexota bacterium]